MDAKAFFADAEVVVSSVEEVLRLQSVDSSEAASHQGSLVGSTLTNGPAECRSKLCCSAQKSVSAVAGPNIYIKACVLA